MFRRNVGGIDRALRFVLAAVLLAGGVVFLARGQGPGWTLTLIGALLLASAVLGYCPPYALFGISTARPGTAAPRPPSC
jgi:quinol-cytochrome oxidoreductase complex cytochrome b subunit